MFKLIFLISSIILVLVDSVYLNIMKNYFQKQVQRIQGSKMEINLVGAAICYLFLAVGINYFIIQPKRSIKDAFLLGLVIYGVFDSTNLALFKNWSFLTFVIDTLWGGVLFAVTTFLTNLFRL